MITGLITLFFLAVVVLANDAGNLWLAGWALIFCWVSFCLWIGVMIYTVLNHIFFGGK